MVKLISDGEEVKFETTIFPDGTSQVWKIDDKTLDPEGNVHILWLFESEAELFHVCQLAHLCYEHFEISPDLVCPYLPYGRQDKAVSNKASFALNTFVEILYNAGICRIETFDAHSKAREDMVYPIRKTVSEFHRHATEYSDLICFPDKGAADRYSRIATLPFVYAKKVRNQMTGEITGLKLITDGHVIEGKRVIIIDDICDGGMTFIKVAEELNKHEPATIDLAVSHGLFSKGKQVLHDAGIDAIYTTNSLLRNPEGFKVW